MQLYHSFSCISLNGYTVFKWKRARSIRKPVSMGDNIGMETSTDPTC